MNDETSRAKRGGTRYQWLGSAVVAIAVSVAAQLLFVWFSSPHFDTRQPELLAPSGYCVARGLGSFPSDALVLPLEWRNPRAEASLVRKPHVILSPREQRDPSPTERMLDEYKFVLDGSYPGLDPGVFSDTYDRRTSLVLPPRSVTSHVLVFRTVGFWNRGDGKYYDLRLEPDLGRWNAYVGYESSRGADLETTSPSRPSFDLPIYDAVADLGDDDAVCFGFRR